MELNKLNEVKEILGSILDNTKDSEVIEHLEKAYIEILRAIKSLNK